MNMNKLLPWLTLALTLILALALAAPTVAHAQNQAYRSGGDPSADPNASLKSCLNHYDGFNLAARTRCYNQHCKGRWGKGDCPQGSDMDMKQGSNSNTPLGICLREAGANPFKRDSCGWHHCNKRWDEPECAALHPKSNDSGLYN